MFAIQRNSDGKYVSISGHRQSYTPRLKYTKLFATREAAQADLCPENEHIINVGNISDIARISF